jgi:hypothetical protein
MTKARDLSKLLSTANGKIAGANLDVSFENIADTGTEGTKVATGTTGQRGSTAGQIRFNSQTGLAEYYTGIAFKSIDASPTISSIDVTEVDSQAGGNQTIVITGSGFNSGATVTFVGNSGTDFNASTVTRDSDTQITAVAPKASFLNAQEPYGVKVENTSGLSATLASQINVDTAPSWSTASGNIGSVEEGYSANFSVSATDPDGDTVSYSETTSVLSGGGFTLNSATGAITGTASAVSGDTTDTFTLRATANSKTADRQFNIIRTNSIALPSDISSWTYPVNETHTTNFDTSNYYGFQFSVKNGDGSIVADFGSYEYPIFSKYSVRSSVNEDVIIQLYNLSANTQHPSFLQFGAVWVNPTTLAQTNSLHAMTELSAGNGVYLVTQGYPSSGTLPFSFYNGGANNNSSAQGSTNREYNASLSYSANNLSFVIKKDTGTNARKIAVYSGNTKLYTYTQQIPSSTSNIYWYIGNGYTLNNTLADWNNLTPKLRYSASTGYNFTV